MSLYRYSNDHENNYPYEREGYMKQQEFHKEPEGKEEDCYEKKGCDSESARALKRILSQLDELNDRDLRILDDIVERVICSRRDHKDYKEF